MQIGAFDFIAPPEFYERKPPTMNVATNFPTFATIPSDEPDHDDLCEFALALPHAMEVLANVMVEGKKDHPDDDWKTQTPDKHIGHAFMHLLRYAQGDKQERHLLHAFTRLAMAIEVPHLQDAS